MKTVRKSVKNWLSYTVLKVGPFLCEAWLQFFPSLFPLLDKGQLNSMESIQKIATRVLLDWSVEGYEQRLGVLHLEPLKTRWENQFKKLSLGVEGNVGFIEFLVPSPAVHEMVVRTRRVYKTPKCATERFTNSPINQAIAIINRYHSENCRDICS